MIELTNDGALQFADAPFNHRVVLAAATSGTEWQPLPLQADGDNFRAANGDTEARLQLKPTDDGWDYALTLAAETPTRLRMVLELPDAEAPYHVIPAVLFGDNNLDKVTRVIFPHLTTEPRDEENCSPYWEFRADRASHPISLAAVDGGIAAITVEPYCDNAQGVVADDSSDFIRNGLCAQLAHDNQPHACGVTFGYRNTPSTYSNKARFLAPTQDRLCRGRVGGSIYLLHAANRLGVHAVIRRVHARTRQPAEHALSRDQGINLLAGAMLSQGWSEADDNFADMKWNFDVGALEPFRGGNDEIAWTGGTQTVVPLLVAGHRTGNREMIHKAEHILDRITHPDSINPDSGWLWDACGADVRSHVGWWTGAIGPAHCAYTNGEALAYLLQAFTYARDVMNLDRPHWRDIPLQVLETALRVQADDGNFGYAYSLDDGSMTDPDGFAGCWFAAALAHAWNLTGAGRYLDAAERAMAHYSRHVTELHCWGTPMDTAKAIDQEGILAYIRAARLLHQFTDNEKYLEMLAYGAEYEYLWRFAIRARPQVPPLAGSNWNSCGGSITSTSNPHIHPMGLLVSGDLAYLADHTGDHYHRRRCDEGLDWALNCIELYPDAVGYGAPGVLTERFCPSDGLLIETWPDNTPASVWFTYHVWGAANALEGLLDVAPAP